MNKKDFQNGCFSPNWIEVDLEEAGRNSSRSADMYYEKGATEDAAELGNVHLNKEASLESRRRKDLNTLLRELDEIKQSIEMAAQKQHRLANLMGFYTGEFAQ